MAAMGLFRVNIEIENLERRGAAVAIQNALVDTGSEYTWVPRTQLEAAGIVPRRKQAFMLADGRRLEREVGYALVRTAGAEAPDLIVFAEPGDLVLLGVHSLEGMNLKVDPVRKELVPAGPVITAGAA